MARIAGAPVWLGAATWILSAFGILINLGVSASSVQKSNEFMDLVLGRLLKGEPASFELDSVRVPDFTITVDSNRITNRMFTARFTNGKVVGLKEIKRKGDCQPTKWVSGNITLECTLDLSGVFASYAVVAKGHTLSGREDPMDVYVRVERSTAQFKAHSLPNRPPAVKTFLINEPLQTKVYRVFRSGQNPVQLNEARDRAFSQRLVEHASRSIRDGVMATFQRVVSRVVAKYADVLLIPPTDMVAL